MKVCVKACMSTPCASNGTGSATFTFPEDFPGFRGHFPDRPVLPGVCLVQAGVALAGAMMHRDVRLKAIVTAKFLSAILPREPVEVRAGLQEVSSQEGLIKVSVRRDGTQIAQLNLRVGW